MAKPFIRYVGGKNWFVKQHSHQFPQLINNYYEPFLGSGSIFFYLKHVNAIKQTAILSDINSDLIETYRQVSLNLPRVIERLKQLKNDRDTFYKIRSNRPTSNLEKAIRYLYLNRTGYGGIYRVNKDGEYNVPYGNRQYKKFIDEENLAVCAKHLSLATKIKSVCVTEQTYPIRENDFFCLDPPYLGDSTPFNRYNEKKFGFKETQHILNLLEEINRKNAKFLLFIGDNTSFLKQVENMYNHVTLNRSNNLSFSNQNNKLTEIIITNY